MKRYLFLFLATLLCSVSAWAFDADNEDGVTLSYEIVTADGYDYACEVAYNDNNYIYAEINIPATAYNASDGNTYTVVGVGKYAFTDAWDLTSITLPSTLLYIGDLAFCDVQMTSVTIPGSIVDFGLSVFAGCSALETVTIEEGITYIGDYMFESCTALTNVSLPNSLTSIGDYAFQYCALKEIELPSNLVSIGNYAFAYSSSLESINIPGTITNLGKGMFYYCQSLSNVTLEEGLTYISDYMFSGCEALTSIDFPNTITTIGEYAFHAGNLTSINLPENCKTIGDYAFYNNLYITELKLPEGLEYIGDYAFYQIFYYITDDDVVLTIPESVTYIGSYAFYHCTNMKQLNILANIDEIQKYTFYQCSYLTTVSIPKTVANIGNSAFYSCTALTSITCLNREAPICGSNVFRSVSTSTCILYVPEGSEDAYADAPIWGTFTHIVGIEVEDDPDGEEKKFEENGVYYQYVDKEAKTVEVTYESTTFYYYTGSITIPTTVTHDGEKYTVIGIGDDAFRLSPELTDITINEGITYIGAHAFYQCDALEGVSLPSGLMEIGASAFYGCTTLPCITIPATVTSILGSAFSGCTALTEMTIPASVTYLGTSIVSGCTNLTTMTLKDGEDPLEVSISSSSLTTTFSNCYISSLYIGRTLSWEYNRYMESPFYDFYTLKYVTFGTQEITVGEYLFRYTSIEDIYIPENVTISDYSFYSCESLKTAIVGASTVGKYAFEHCNGLKEVTLLETVTNLGYYAFESCTSLEEVTLSSDRSGSMDCFMACSAIKKVTLTENVNRVVEWTFYGYNMEEIYSFNPTPPSLGKYSFAYPNKETCVVYVPVGAYDDYKAADIWEDFFNIVEMTEFAIETLAATNITDTSATLNGSVTAAYDDPITEKGFEYWTGNEEALKAVVEGDEMTAIVTNLEAETTYTYRAYAVMESGTTEYGETITFTTTEVSDGISNVVVSTKEMEGIYSTSGQKLNNMQHGVNIIRYADGTTKKVLVK